MDKVLGFHHITAIASDPKTNLDFYTKVLGQRLVKKTVNFDDPGTYHFYFGNEVGTPGTILTFFPWPRARKGFNGAGMATEIAYSVPLGSLDFWKERFKEFNIEVKEVNEKFGEKYLPFCDPDGLHLNLVEVNNDNRKAWETNEIKADAAARGFQSVVLTLRRPEPTIAVLTDILGYHLDNQEGDYYRFKTEAVDNANIVDLVIEPHGQPGLNAAGTNHHVAFRVKDDNILMDYREKALRKGLSITPKIDRDYFFSLYFREPGGVLFELATDNPGFTKDEPLDQLGRHLKLPKHYEERRKEIESLLQQL